jgi:hypothetical protein
MGIETPPAVQRSMTEEITKPAAGAENAGRTWRVWVTRHPIGAALISGFAATHIATIFGLWFHGIGLPDLNWPVTNGNVVVPKATTAVKFGIGEFIHGVDGLVFTLIFALFLFPILAQAVNPMTNMAKALFFSLVLATISAGFMVPYVYAPHAGAGLFSTGFGWKTTFAIYLWHVVFGVNLGLLYDPYAADDPVLRS